MFLPGDMDQHADTTVDQCPSCVSYCQCCKRCTSYICCCRTCSRVPLISLDTSTTSRIVGWNARRVCPRLLAACIRIVHACSAACPMWLCKFSVQIIAWPVYHDCLVPALHTACLPNWKIDCVCSNIESAAAQCVPYLAGKRLPNASAAGTEQADGEYSHLQVPLVQTLPKLQLLLAEPLVRQHPGRSAQ